MSAPTFQEAVDYAASRNIVLPDVYYGKLAGVQRSQAVSIAGLASLDQIKAIIDLVRGVLDSGGTFADFQKKVKAGELSVTLSKARLDNIFRTNLQAAYARGRYEQQNRVSFARPYWMYDAINDSRVRHSHAAMDGTILHHSHPWWKTHYPPNGYRCRCTVISLTEAQARKRGISGAPPQADPDEGWDYSVDEDYNSAVNGALDNYTTDDPASKQAVEDVKKRVKEARDAAREATEGPKKPSESA
jgi:SPP1 gp7 family putative phage head morphogenesis protein